MRILKRGAFATLVCCLLGCNSQPTVPELNQEPPLPTKIAGTSDRSIPEITESLRLKNVNVVSIGQENLIAVPTLLIFPDKSPRLNWGGYEVLNEAACLIKQYRKVEIYVTAYTGKYRSNLREQSLTLARARTVANYLWSQGVDSRLMVARGRGADKPVVGLENQADNTPNSRIEITFREVIT